MSVTVQIPIGGNVAFSPMVSCDGELTIGENMLSSPIVSCDIELSIYEKHSKLHLRSRGQTTTQATPGLE